MGLSKAQREKLQQEIIKMIREGYSLDSVIAHYDDVAGTHYYKRFFPLTSNEAKETTVVTGEKTNEK